MGNRPKLLSERFIVGNSRVVALLRTFNKQVLFNLVFVLFNQGSTFLANIAISRILGRDLFGHYILTLNTVVSIASLAGLGMGYTATKFTAEFQHSDVRRAGQVLGFCEVLSIVAGLVGMVILIGFAGPIGSHYLATPQLSRFLRLAAPLVLLSSVNAYFIGTLAGLSSFRTLALAGVISGMAYFGLSVFGAFTAGIDGALLGIVAGYLIQFLLLAWLTRAETSSGRNPIPISYRNARHEGEITKTWVIPGVLNGITAVPTLWLLQTFLVRFTHDFHDVADYNAAYSFLVLLIIVPYIINSVGMPFITNLLGRREQASYRDFFWANLGMTTLTIVVGALFIAAIGRPLLRMYGPGYAQAYPYLLIFLLAAIPESLTIAISQVLQSKGKAWLYLLGINVPRDTTMLVCAYFWVQRFGPMGLCYAYLTGRVFGVALTTFWTVYVGLDLGPNAPLEKAVNVQSV